MNNHSFAQARYLQAKENYLLVSKALETGDMAQFSEVVENEALSLHALMMSAKPGYFLISPETLRLIDKIRDFREQKNTPVCFTLDAGPNIHVLYPAEAKNEVLNFLESETKDAGKNLHLLYDEVGEGPRNLIES